MAIVTAGACAVLLLAAGASSAEAAATVSPNSGPTAGGTSVTISAGVTGFAAVAAGGDSAYAIGDDGHIYAWGDGSSGQLGNGAFVGSHLPVQVSSGAIPAGVTIVQIVAGYSASAWLLGSDGHIYSWGSDTSGALGDGGSTNQDTPVRVLAGAIPLGVTITQIAAGGSSAYALGSNGYVYSWGLNSQGQLGNGTLTPSSVPVQVSAGAIPLGVRVTRIIGGYSNAFAFGSDGHIYSWGGGGLGDLGDGVNGDSHVPVQVVAGVIPAGVTITALAAQQDGAYALGSDGHIYSWGYNALDELGDGLTTSTSSPVLVIQGAVPVGVTFTQVGGTSGGGYGVGSDGHIYAWGYNQSSQLGNGNSASSASPVQVLSTVIPVGVTVATIGGGYHTGYALGSDGRIYGWGENTRGEIGNNAVANANSAVLGPNVIATGVTFGGVAGTAFGQANDITTVVAPAHAAGVVLVAVLGTVYGGASVTTIVSSTMLAAAYTYKPLLASTGVDFPWNLLVAALVALPLGMVLVALRRPSLHR